MWRYAEPFAFAAVAWVLLNIIEQHFGRVPAWLIGGTTLFIVVVVLYRRWRK